VVVDRIRHLLRHEMIFSDEGFLSKRAVVFGAFAPASGAGRSSISSGGSHRQRDSLTAILFLLRQLAHRGQHPPEAMTFFALMCAGIFPVITSARLVWMVALPIRTPRSGAV